MNGNAILFVKVIDIALAIIKDNTYDNDINVNVLFLNFRWTFLANIEETAANRLNIAEDNDGALVFLARNAWHLNKAQEDFPKVKFAKIKG